ncbi:MAG: Kef-type K+ transport system membrane component KefB [Flavobacteriales bacterium]|jgi:Kef-type K+ transport system membrane component KefB
MNTYIIVIVFSLVIILSYWFNLLAKKTRIPSVLLLIVLGIGLQYGIKEFYTGTLNLMPALEILGIVGLIMIVLEAALDLELKAEKWPIIWKSFLLALLILGASAFFCAYVLQYLFFDDLFTSLVYAIPLSIMSSAIIIPSVGSLREDKKEFMIYESTFSDILGIMFFYFLVGNDNASSSSEVIGNIGINISVTILLAIVVSYGLILLFQNIKTEVKLFLLISVLVLLYSIGKLFHLSSLLIILVFGLILNNHKLFFKGFLKQYLRVDKVHEILEDFHMVTMESAFVVRTFFFVIFGMTIELGVLLDFKVALTGMLITTGFFVIRYLFFKIIMRKNIFPEWTISPRGLITILLFFAIPLKYQQDNFDPGILLYVIIISSLVMTYTLIQQGKIDDASNEKLGADEINSDPTTETSIDNMDLPKVEQTDLQA